MNEKSTQSSKEKSRPEKTEDFIKYNHPFKDIAIKVFEERDNFSLSEEFNLEKAKSYNKDLNAVTIITPTQTVSRFNDTSENGLVGSGHHSKNIREIIAAIYGNFLDTGQDIIIRYINCSNNCKNPLRLYIEIPSKINMSQVNALTFLNDEIKKIENETKIQINCNSVSIIPMPAPIYKSYKNLVENETNLDKIIENILASQSFSSDFKKELCLISYPNNENHFNDSSFKIDVNSHQTVNNTQQDTFMFSYQLSKEEIDKMKKEKIKISTRIIFPQEEQPTVFERIKEKHENDNLEKTSITWEEYKGKSR